MLKVLVPVLACLFAVSLGDPWSDLVNDYWTWRLADAPEFATQIEVHTYDQYAEQYTTGVLEQRKITVEGYLHRIKQIARVDLRPEDRVSYDVLKDTLETYLAGYRWRNYGPMNPVNFLEGIWNDVGWFTPTNLVTREDFTRFAARISDWAAQALNMQTRMQQAIKEKTTNHWVSMNESLTQLDGLIGNATEGNEFYMIVENSLNKSALSTQEKNDIQNATASAVFKLRKNFLTLKHFITTEYKNHTRKSFGVNSFPDGEEYYKACLKWHLSTDDTPEQVHQIGLREVHRIYGEMTKVMSRLGFNGTVKKFFESLNKNPNFFLKTGKEIIDRYSDIIFHQAQPKLAKYFKNIPNKPVRVQEMPNEGPGGSYSFGSQDGSRPGVFYANVRRPHDTHTYAMVALSLHEADPGHHLQDIYSQAASGIPMFRKVIDFTKYFSVPYHFPFYTAYTEGWALYAESLGEADQLNIYKDDYELMGRYSSEIFRACRLVVDTGLHYYNWTRDQGIAYMLNYTAYSETAMTVEIDRYITWPGQACAYKIGELKIKELRAKAETELGNKYDIRDFHSVILDNGAVPLKVLEQLVDDWIAKRQEVSIAEQFSELIMEYWAWRMEDSPEFAWQTDDHKYDDRVEQYNIGVFDDRKDMVEAFLHRLQYISRAGLSPKDQTSYDVLQNTLETYLEGYKWRNYGPMNPVNFLEGLWNDPEMYAPTSLTTKKEFMDFITRVFGWADQALNMMIRMRRSIQEKTTDNWVSLKDAVPQIEDLIGHNVSENVFSKLIQDLLDNSTLSDQDRAELTATADLTVAHLRETYSTLKRFILTEYKNYSRDAFGVNSLPDGEEYYKACLKWHLSTDHTPEQVHQIGLQEVDRIHAEMVKTVARLGFNGTVKEFFAAINNDSKFFLTPAQTKQRYHDIIFERVKPKLSKLFRNIPNNPVIIEEMKYDGPGGMYRFGSPDGSRPGVFFVNLKNKENNPTYYMMALALHEADPGHHMQDIFSQASPGLELFRRVVDDSKYFSPPLHFPFYTAYGEGWGLYAESLGEKDQLDLYKDDYELMGRYSSEIFRACRLVVDTGLHYYNWTRRDGIDYMLNYTAESEASMATEIDRYITWPGQACAYKIGELKIKELRAKAEAELGDKFDIRDFHSIVLDNGAIPLQVLEQLVDAWISEQKDTIDKIMQDFFDWRLESSPEFATYYVDKYNDKLDSFAYETFEIQLAGANKFLKRLQDVDKSSLDSDKQISFDVLENMLQTFIDGYKWRNYGALNPINFLSGYFTDIGGFVGGFPMETQGDILNAIRRIELAPKQLDEMISISRKAIKLGHTSNNVSVSRVPQHLIEFVKQAPMETGLYKPFKDVASQVLGDQRSYMDQKLQVAIKNFQSKVQQLETFLETEYMPATRTGLGLSTLPNGSDVYRACLKWHTSLDLAPEDVHTTGLDEVKRITGLMKQAMKRLGFNENTTIAEAYGNLTNNPKFLLETGDMTLERFREIIFKRIQPQISQYFKNAPNLPLEVKPSPSDGIGGSYGSGSEDGSRPGVFYANVRRPKDHPTYTMVSLSLHEAIPGHHLAESYSMVSDLPAFRKHMAWRAYNAPYFFPFFNSYVEGWALYSEYLGEEMGIYHDDSELMGRYSDEMLRATRLVIDTGIHFYNWTRDRAIQYMLDHTAESPESAAIEIDRYATWPGQACGYKLGEIKIKELRRKAETALGKSFVLRDFHYAILKNGAVPMDVLQKIVDNWVASVKAEVPTKITIPHCETSGSQVLKSFSIVSLVIQCLTLVIVIQL